MLNTSVTPESLVGKYVCIDEGVTRCQHYGVVCQVSEGDPSAVWVMYFKSRRFRPVPISCCREVPAHAIREGLVGNEVQVPGFGRGTVIGEYVNDGSELILRVQAKDKPIFTTIEFWQVRVLVP